MSCAISLQPGIRTPRFVRAREQHHRSERTIRACMIQQYYITVVTRNGRPRTSIYLAMITTTCRDTDIGVSLPHSNLQTSTVVDDDRAPLAATSGGHGGGRTPTPCHHRYTPPYAQRTSGNRGTRGVADANTICSEQRATIGAAAAARRRRETTTGTSMTAATANGKTLADGFVGGKLRGGRSSAANGRPRHARQPKSAVDDDAGNVISSVLREASEDDSESEVRWDECDMVMCARGTYFTRVFRNATRTGA